MVVVYEPLVTAAADAGLCPVVAAAAAVVVAADVEWEAGGRCCDLPVAVDPPLSLPLTAVGRK